MVGISKWGAYIPRLRLSRKAVTSANAWIAPGLSSKGKGERAMANWDEDSVTMAVEACRDALGPQDDRSHIDMIYFSSTTAPFADRLNAGIVAAALTLETSINASDIAGSQRCGVSALVQAFASVRGGDSRNALVVASEKRRSRAASSQELDWGDAATAFIVADEDVSAELIGHGVVTVDFVDHFRGADNVYDYQWEERWVRDEGISKLAPEAIAKALASAGIEADQVTHFCLPSTFRGIDAQVAKRCGISAEAVRDNLAATVGEAGSAHPLVMLAHTLETAKPGDIVLVAQFGQGCEALVLRVTDLIAENRPARGVGGNLADRKEESNYLRYLFFNGLVDWEKGMRAEKDSKTALSTLYRNRNAIQGLVAGRCSKTGAVQFPPSRLSVDVSDGLQIDTQEPHKLADRPARVLSWSADYLTYALAPPSHYGQIDFEGGGRIYMDITDVETGEVVSGMPVRMVFRLKEIDEVRGFRRYFWKAVPVRTPATQNED